MADRALTEDAMLAGLHDIRLPAEAPGGTVAEVLVAIGIGILLAVAAAALYALLSQARGSVVRPPVAEDIPDAGAESRALLRQLKRERPERYADIARDLYRPGGMPVVEALRNMVGGR